MPTQMELREAEKTRPILYTLYVDDPEYVPDPDIEPDGEPGRRPLRFNYNPTKYDSPNREDMTPFEPFRQDWGRWLPRFIEHYRQTNGLHKAARKTGISPETVARWRRCSPDFDRWLMDIHEERVDAVEDSLMADALTPKQVIAKAIYLNAHRPDRYKRPGTPEQLTAEVKVTGPDGGPIQVVHTVQFIIPDNGRNDRAKEPAIEGEFSEQAALANGESGT